MMLKKTAPTEGRANSLLQSPLFVLVMFGVCTLISHSLAYGVLGQARFCCDATSYLYELDGLSTAMLYEDVPLNGYRSIVTYILITSVRTWGALFAAKAPTPDAPHVAYYDAAYAYGAYIIFLVTGAALIVLRYRWRTSFAPIVGIYFNPIVISFIPLPVQECLYILFLAPLIVLGCWLIERREHSWIGFVATSAAALAYIIKPSMIPLSVLFIGLAFYHWRQAAWRERSISIIAAAVVAGLMIAPQSIAMQYRFGTWRPYPNNEIRDFQFKAAWEMWRYETIFDRGYGHPRPFPTSFTAPEQPLLGLAYEPLKAWALMWGHLLGAFDFSTLKTYIVRTDMPRPPFGNIAVGLVVAGGLFRLLQRRAYTSRDFLLDATLLATIAPLPLIAVESRFALVPMMMFGVRFAEWVPTRPAGWKWLVAVAIGLAFATIIMVGQFAVGSFVPA